MRPHLLWAGEPHSALKRARVRALLTLEELADRAAVSTSLLHQMETAGTGSDTSWAKIAAVLDVAVDAIRPVADPRQATIQDLLAGQLVPAMTTSS